ncbi:MAG: ABC transporter permease [Ignavibacteria bacterium]|nr:ABC transporter permease [Ignavibacteria bacterium]
MGFESFIAKRYVRSKKHVRMIHVIMLVSLVGITVGVAALVVVMSVFNGFNGVVTSVLVGFDPHLRIDPEAGRILTVDEQLGGALRSNERIVAWSPYIQSKAILVVRNQNRVVFVKGVVDSMVGRVSGVSGRIILGEMSFRDSLGTDGIVLGRTLADRLGAIVGSELMVVSPVGADALALQMGQPESRRCRVTGIYDSNNKDYDANYAYISLDLARRLFDYGGGVSGIEARVDDLEDAELARQELEEAIGDRYLVSTWYDLHRDLYAVMRIERWGAFVILSLIISVAMFNVLGSLTMSVLTKRRDIGVLRAMGATKGKIRNVFLYEGVMVGMIGTILGTLLGLVICYLQIEYHLIPLDTAVYIIPAIPVEIHWNDVVAISMTSLAFNTVAAFIPANRAAGQTIVDSVRWE